MANKLQHGKIIAVFNDYLNTDTPITFSKFCQEKKYVSGVPAVFDIDNVADETALTLVDKKFGTQKRKVENILTFIASRPELFDAGTITNVKEQVFNFCEKYDYNIKINDEVNDFLKDYKFFNVHRRKRHGKAKSFAKKVLVPSAIVAAITGLASAAISATASAVGSSLFISTAPWLDIIDHFALGAAAGFVATPVYMKASKHIVRNVYSKKGTKGSNLTQLDNANVDSVQDVKNLNLPISDLLSEISSRQDKINDLMILGTNPFRHPINAFKKYWNTKRSRDAMHEVMAFYKKIEAEIANAENAVAEDNENNTSINAAINSKIEKYRLLQSMIDQSLDQIERKVSIAMTDRDLASKSNKQLFEYSDIRAKQELEREGIDTSDYNVDKRVDNMFERRIDARFTNGTESLDEATLMAKTVEAQAKKLKLAQEKEARNEAYIRAEHSLLDIEKNGNMEAVIAASGINKNAVNKILELIHANQYTTKGKVKANQKSLALYNKGALLETEVDGKPIREAYSNLLKFINNNPQFAKAKEQNNTEEKQSNENDASAILL